MPAPQSCSVVLVPTIIKTINDDQVGKILQFASITPM
jgi:uncharacterized radical SAM superfamily Fe-S cluster-containing enzyme